MTAISELDGKWVTLVRPLWGTQGDVCSGFLINRGGRFEIQSVNSITMVFTENDIHAIEEMKNNRTIRLKGPREYINSHKK